MEFENSLTNIIKSTIWKLCKKFVIIIIVVIILICFAIIKILSCFDRHAIHNYDVLYHEIRIMILSFMSIFMPKTINSRLIMMLVFLRQEN